MKTDIRPVGKLGYYLPVSLFGAVLIAIGNGLVSTFVPGTSEGKWIGYQILLGAGSGSSLQMVGLASCWHSCLCSAACADCRC